MYERENPDYWAEIRRLEVDYEKKRMARIEYYEAVKHAQAVTVDEIPLPNLDMPSVPGESVDGLTMDPSYIPNASIIPTHSILKSTSYVPSSFQIKEPPGCPPTLPPAIYLYNEGDQQNNENRDIESDIDQLVSKSRSVRFADGEEEEEEDKDTRLTVKLSQNMSSNHAKFLQMAGQDIDDFMRESEVLFNEKVAERQSDQQTRDENADGLGPHSDAVPPVGVPQPFPEVRGPNAEFGQVPPHGPPGVPPPTGVPPPVMLRPPPPRGAPSLLPGMGVPLGPPPTGLPPRLLPPLPVRPPLRIPGGPPGMLPPGMPLRGFPPFQNPNVLSAEPQLIARPKEGAKNRSITIEAKPQMRFVFFCLFLSGIVYC